MINFKQYRAPISLLSILILSGCSSLSDDETTDEYDYLTAPIAAQLADLNDGDLDGVINARDLCATTVVGSKINNDGCGNTFDKEAKQQLHILFAHNSSVINPIFSGQIKDMAAFLSDYPSTSIEINGYASKVGTEEFNLNLSKQRAEAIKASLVNYGVDPARITIVGYGEADPVIDDDSEYAATSNRRVTATVVNSDSVIEKQWTIFTKIPRNANSY